MTSRLLAVLWCFPLAVSVAQQPIAPGVVVSGTLSFDGRATLGDFIGKTDSVSGTMTGGASLAQVRGSVFAPVTSLVTGNGKRDKDLRKSMESDKYPTIRFDLDETQVLHQGPDSTTVRLGGRLTIHGVEKSVAPVARLEFQPGGGMTLVTDFPVDLNDYQIGGLSKMLGLLKMHPDIVVHVRLRFGPATGAGDRVGASPAGTPPTPG